MERRSVDRRISIGARRRLVALAIRLVLPAVGLFTGCASVDRPPTTITPVGGVGTIDALMRWSSCEMPDTTVVGRPERACAALDGPCHVGGLVATEDGGACCSLTPRPAGAACGEGSFCDDAGQCVLAGKVSTDRDGDGILDAEDPVIGDERWVRTPLRDLAVRTTSDAVELRVAGESWVRLRPPIDLSTLRFDRDSQWGWVSIEAPGPGFEVLWPLAGEICLSRDGESEPGLGTCARLGAESIACPGTVRAGRAPRRAAAGG